MMFAPSRHVNKEVPGPQISNMGVTHHGSAAREYPCISHIPQRKFNRSGSKDQYERSELWKGGWQVRARFHVIPR